MKSLQSIKFLLDDPAAVFARSDLVMLQISGRDWIFFRQGWGKGREQLEVFLKVLGFAGDY
jgi:hypothetical protein